MNDRVLRQGITVLGGLLILWLGSLPLLALAQEPTGPAFVYQGRLRQADVYLNVSCDFRFGLFDAPAGGGQLGASQTVAGVTVRDGYFRVILNEAGQFGPIAFTGARRYLGMAVRCPGDVTFVPMGARVEMNPVPYAQYALSATNAAGVAWGNITAKPAGFADDIDNDNPYTPGFGLALSGTQFSLVTGTVLSGISSGVQLRVTGTCPLTQSIQRINPDGSVVCANTTTVYNAGLGVLLNPDGVFSINFTETQRLVTGTCGGVGSLRAIRTMLPNGGVGCTVLPVGDITEVVAGTGLTVSNGQGPGEVGLQVGPGQIDSALLGDGAVTVAKLAPGAITRPKLNGALVTSDKVANGTILFEDFGFGCDGSVPMLKWNGTRWECAQDLLSNFSTGNGLTLNGNILSAILGDGLTFINGAIAANMAGTGVATTVARSEHTHAQYIQYSSSIAPLDVTGTYTNLGFKVQGLRGKPIVGTPSDHSTLLYSTANGGQWESVPYGFAIDVCYNSVAQNGEAAVQCSTNNRCPGYTMVGGGCQCGSGEEVSDTWPATSYEWHCRCAGDTFATAYAVCAKPRPRLASE